MLISLKNRCLLNRLRVFKKRRDFLREKNSLPFTARARWLEGHKLGSPKARWFAGSARQKLGNDQARTSLSKIKCSFSFIILCGQINTSFFCCFQQHFHCCFMSILNCQVKTSSLTITFGIDINFCIFKEQF